MAEQKTTAVQQARAKAQAGERLTKEDALALYEDNDLLFLAKCARAAQRQERVLHGKPAHQPHEHLQLELSALRLSGGAG